MMLQLQAGPPGDYLGHDAIIDTNADAVAVLAAGLGPAGTVEAARRAFEWVRRRGSCR